MEANTFTLNGKSIVILEGDITARICGAIVNAANNHLWMGSGVAGAIKRKGGELVEREAVAQGPIAVGEAVVTSAGSLPCKYVIHAAAMGQDLSTDTSKISAAVKNSLLRCADFKIESVSMPAIGTGVGGFSVGKCAEIMLKAAAEHLIDAEYPRKIEFVLFGESAYGTFLSAAREFFETDDSVADDRADG